MAAALGTEASNEIIYCSNTFKSSIFFHVASMGNIKNLMISHTQLEQGLVSIYLVCQQQWFFSLSHRQIVYVPIMIKNF